MHYRSEPLFDQGKCLSQAGCLHHGAWHWTIVGRSVPIGRNPLTLLADSDPTWPQGKATDASLAPNNTSDSPLVFSITTYDATTTHNSAAVASIQEASGSVHGNPVQLDVSGIHRTVQARDSGGRTLLKN